MRRTKPFLSKRMHAFFVIALVSIFAFLLVGCEGGLFAQPTETPVPPTETPIPPTATPEPTATRTPRPTSTPKPSATPILETATPDFRYECIPYDMIGEVHIDETVCVYGTIVKWTSGGGYAAVLRFTELNDNFLVRSVRYYWPGIEEGDCVGIVGQVIYNGTYFYIEFDKDGDNAEIFLSDQCP